MQNKIYLCIDLKTFFASVECVERGLDPFKVNLVVADNTRGNGALCLAISTDAGYLIFPRMLIIWSLNPE